MRGNFSISKVYSSFINSLSVLPSNIISSSFQLSMFLFLTIPKNAHSQFINVLRFLSNIYLSLLKENIKSNLTLAFLATHKLTLLLFSCFK